jgi:hypothetical protein
LGRGALVLDKFNEPSLFILPAKQVQLVKVPVSKPILGGHSLLTWIGGSCATAVVLIKNNTTTHN